jgi:hypothetical protein
MMSAARFVLPCLLFLGATLNAFGAIRSDGATLVVHEVPVLTLKGTVAGFDPAKRATLAAKRLASMPEGAKLSVKREGKAHLLLADGTTILQIDPSDAKAYGTTTAALAETWLAALQRAAALPAVRLSKSQIVLPVGGSATVEMIGKDVPVATFASSSAAVAAERSAAGLVVRGLQPGESTVTATGPTGSATLTVRVLPMAAEFPQSLGVEVVGAPATSEMVASTVQGAVQTRFAALPAAKVTLGKIEAGAVAGGISTIVNVRVKVEAPDAFPAEGVVSVRVANPGLRHIPETELWYCNEPERVTGPQELFRGTLRPEQPVRALYHYINDSSAPLFLRADVVNASEVPARVAIIPGDSTPHRNPVLAGLDAADRFLREWLAGSGEIVTIPPGQSLPLVLRNLGRLDTASGLCYLRLLPGGPESLRVVVNATDPTPLDARGQAAERSPTPWREIGFIPTSADRLDRRGDNALVFPNPFKEESVTYRVGGNFGFLRIGQKPIPRKEGGRPLDGNFGVVYRVQARAENPTDRAANVEVVFEASAGYSGALFVVNGELRRISPIQPKQEVQLLRFRLEPGESRDVRLLTVPLSGSSYPATLAVRPVHALPKL